MPEWTCFVCDPPAVIPYDRRASSSAVWRGHCARVHPDGTTPLAEKNGEKHPVRVKWNTVSGIGYGLCQCGARSTITDSSNHRREWHKRHKAEVLGSV